MKLTKTVLAIASLSISNLAFADVNLKTVQEISVIAINGEEIGGVIGNFIGNSGDYVLPDGLNQIVVRVSKLIRESNGELDKYNSTPVVITFEAAGKDLELAFGQKIDDYNHVKVFESNPNYNLFAVDGSSLQYQQETLPRGAGLLRNYEKDIASYNRQYGIKLQKTVAEETPKVAPIEMTTSQGGKVVGTEASTKEVEPMPSLSADSVNELKTKFSGLNEEQRKQFLTWAVSQ